MAPVTSKFLLTNTCLSCDMARWLPFERLADSLRNSVRGWFLGTVDHENLDRTFRRSHFQTELLPYEGHED
jgi:hypothetical protein